MFEWVDSDQRLTELTQQWRQQTAIALDTEFIRTRTFYPDIGLLQIADAQGIYLLDPLAITDPQPLRELFTDTQIVKVLHSCSEDLEVFSRYLQVLPTPLFDTQLAAGFVGLGPSLGYANLVESLLGKAIAKQETRSDWLQRPLSDAQLRYAALDVEDLLIIYQQLWQQLVDLDRLAWVEADCQQLLNNLATQEAPEDYYLRIKSAWKLNPQQLTILRQLSSWRELLAREHNLPRNRVVKDTAMLTMAQRKPKTLKALRTIADIHPGFIQRHGQACLAIIEAALAQPPEPQPLPPPLDREQTELLRRLKTTASSIAEQLRLPPELLVRKKSLEQLVRQVDNQQIALPQQLLGWRHSIIGQPLINALICELP